MDEEIQMGGESMLAMRNGIDRWEGAGVKPRKTGDLKAI